MEVTNINYTPSVTGPSGVSRSVAPAKPEKPDTVSLSPEALSAADYIQKVKDMNEVRPSSIGSLKSQVANGSYPPPAIIEGLARLLGVARKKED